jgi:UDP-MurNAc hydroxylase
MKFTILSHAGMLIEDKGHSLLVDPWLIGSCYWRSWWNFPEIDRAFLDTIKPDYIYLTHLHWDHFHAPSLRLFDRDVKYLVPKIPGERMVRDLKAIKRENIVEIPHGGTVELWTDCFLHSFQFGAFSADSACVIQNKETTIFDANDCKIFGAPLRQILKRFPKIDFCMRSHSSATPIPYTIEGYKETFSDLRTQQDYIEEFTNFCLAAGARYAVPFASNHCFLHRETEKFNETVVHPQMVAEHYNSSPETKRAGSECVVMIPGSSWDSAKGFELREFNYADKDRQIAELKEKYQAKYEKQYEKEAKAKANFKFYEQYFQDFIKSTPALIRKNMLPTVLWKITESEGERLFLCDLPNRKFAEVAEEPETDVTIRVPAIVMNDCVRKKMFSVWSASKRLEISLKDGKLGKLETLFALLDLYETDGLPLRNHLSARNFPIWARRWREGFEAVKLVLFYKLLRRKFVVSELYNKSRPNNHNEIAKADA